MCALRRSIAISAKPRILRPCSANSPRKTTHGSPRYANDLPYSGRPVRAEIQRGQGTGSCGGPALHAARARARPARAGANPAVGAVVVKDGVIVGRGWTQPGGRPHAEPEALRRAGEAARGATLYVTLEPCSHVGKSPPCADAVIAAGIARVVAAIEDPNPLVAGQGHAKLRAAGIAVDVGLNAAEAAHDHAGHFRRIRDNRPHVILKLAVSADDKIGAVGHKPVAITGEAAKTRVHLLRAQSDAILVGIGTVLADDPSLTCRRPGMEARSPVRVVLDRSLRIPGD